ncbi:MAG: arylsulfatase [Planctomycetaceae bacterium]|nr:MAG: arylsulfatase [Planctomycetaceae bacterium]
MQRLTVTAMLWGGFWFVGAVAEDRPLRPNIVCILADDLGFSDLGCYGGEIETPHLDALAAGGLRFTQFYNTARCWPSRASLLTGYYAQQVRRDVLPGVPSGNTGVRPAWARLIPEWLRSVGYRSYHAGKWHVDGPKLAAGFARSYDCLDHNNYFQLQRESLDDQPLPADAMPGAYVTTRITDHALQFLDEHMREYAGQPFFLYLAYTAPHFPLQALPADIARYRERYRAGWDTLRVARWERQQQMQLISTALSALEEQVGPPYDFPEAFSVLGPGEIKYPLPWDKLTAMQQEFQAVKMAIHAAMVHAMDREIGRVISWLQRHQVFEQTLIMFASDNGASAEIMVRGLGHDPTAAAGSAQTFLCLGPGFSSLANTPFRRHKTWVHEGGIASPLIVHWPRGISVRGELRHTPCHIIDLAATMLDVAGVTLPATWGENRPRPVMPARSLVPLWSRDDAAWSQRPLWWSHEGNQALRQGDWKVVRSRRDMTWELYNLAVDRAEQHDLSHMHPERVQQLVSLWEEMQNSFVRDALLDPPPPAPSGSKKGGKNKK